MRPGWDVSPDGQQLAAQVVQTVQANAPTSSIETLNIVNNSPTGLLAQLPSTLLAHDLELTWGPDNQFLVATGAHAYSQDGPYSATLANPAAMQVYTPDAAGPVAWKSDSSAFTLQSADTATGTNGGQVYLFTPGASQGQVLMTNSRDFVWG